ncbi:MAG: NAD(P)/FAD-dependent oxidoreductase [Chloroflexi bacterium]|nr:NAD(P)/FAD-dependent oxidoreductase [Chloroflexota bacterium]
MSDAEYVDVAIIGAGVVGLAVAAELSSDRSVALLERHESYGRENSSHNSGVIHAGIYYPPDWLKTTLCIAGNRLLYAWADDHSVRVRRTGKLIIAQDEGELPALEELLSAARLNGVPELELLSQRQVVSLEPSVEAVAAISSRSTGVIDQMELMRSLESAAVANGTSVAYVHDVQHLERSGVGFELDVRDPQGGELRLVASALVNSAGLAADRLAEALGYDVDGEPRMRQTVNKGRYYDIVTPEKASRLQRLIYPLPHADRSGLGTHVTLDIDGGVHLGPDTEWLEGSASLDYRADDARRAEFLAAAQRFLPWLEADDLLPGQVGYRTKLSGPGEPPRDFLIWEDDGYVHLGGIESPGMTASLAIASRVRELMG